MSDMEIDIKDHYVFEGETIPPFEGKVVKKVSFFYGQQKVRIYFEDGDMLSLVLYSEIKEGVDQHVPRLDFGIAPAFSTERGGES